MASKPKRIVLKDEELRRQIVELREKLEKCITNCAEMKTKEKTKETESKMADLLDERHTLRKELGRLTTIENRRIKRRKRPKITNATLRKTNSTLNRSSNSSNESKDESRDDEPDEPEELTEPSASKDESEELSESEDEESTDDDDTKVLSKTEKNRLAWHKKIKQDARAIKWKLLSDTYVNAHTKITFRCDKRHIIQKSAAHFNLGYGCPVCTHTSPEAAKEAFLDLLKKEEYKQKSKYIKTHAKITLICPKNHEWETTPTNFKDRGIRCSHCKPAYSEKQFYEELAAAEYTLLGEYVRSDERIAAVCSKGHKITVCPHDFRDGARCARCSKKSADQAAEELFELAEKRDYEILDPYVNNTTALRAICPEHHEFEMMPQAFK